MSLKEFIRKYPLYFSLLYLFFIFSLLYALNFFLFAPKILLLILIISITLVLGKFKLFINDWFVFLSFIYFSDTMRGLIYLGICKLNKPVLTQYVIHLEKQLFGQIPSVFLQNILLDKSEPLSLSWLEKTLTFIHGTHYIAFLFVGFIIWIYKKQSFREYKLAFYLLVSSGISLYFLIPTTPPWIAYELFEAVPELIHFNTEIYNMHIPDLTSKFGTNPVAAMPSLHTAFPLLCAFLLFKYFRWKSWPFLVYTTAVLFTIVYTGDHYFIDIIAGAILALLSFFLPSIIKKNLKKKPKIGSNSIPANLKLNKRAIIIGLCILALGIFLGIIVQQSFEQNPIYLDIEAAYPNYKDYFAHINDYKDDFKVNLTYGNHLFSRKQFQQAYIYYQRALILSRNQKEKNLARFKIRICQSLVKKSNDHQKLRNP